MVFRLGQYLYSGTPLLSVHSLDRSEKIILMTIVLQIILNARLFFCLTIRILDETVACLKKLSQNDQKYYKYNSEC